jgi:serine phosphatase RsbU (regulator of sigma subunit)
MTVKTATDNPAMIREHRMECMELWGGSRETHTAVAMTGLRGQILSRAYGEGQSGGDVYYFSSCASGRISRVLLADVTGHGEAVAKTGSALRDVMRRNVNVVRQSKLMTALNREFGQITRAGGFATAVVVTHFTPTGTLTVSVAGHPPPLLFRASVGQWSLVEDAVTAGSASHPKDLPLGISEEVGYSNISLPFGAGDLFLMYTDAFSEARTANGEMLGSKGLVDLLNQASADERSQAIPWLVARLERLSKRNLTDDDGTIIQLQTTDAGIPMKNNFLAPWRMLRGVTEATV